MNNEILLAEIDRLIKAMMDSRVVKTEKEFEKYLKSNREWVDDIYAKGRYDVLLHFRELVKQSHNERNRNVSRP